MSVFVPMVDVIAEGRVGEAEVQHFEVDAAASRFTALRGGREFVPPGRYVRLKVGGQLYMSDTSYEQRSNYEVVRRAHGRVLIAGLGIGMILLPILRKKEVSAVVVVEKSNDVVALIEPQVRHKKLSVVTADIFEWKPAKGEKFNVIYFDIWADQSTDDLAEMATLHQRFKYHLDRSDDYRWMQSWNREVLLDDRRREKSEIWWRE